MRQESSMSLLKIRQAESFNIKITGSTGLSKDEVERMKKEAEVNAAADLEKKDKIEAHNKADNMLYIAEKTLKDSGNKAKPEDKL